MLENQQAHFGFQNLEGNALTNLPEDFVELKRLFHLDLRGNPLSPHLQTAAGDCQSKRYKIDQKMCRLLSVSCRECEMAAGRVMKFQAVYQQKCQKVRKEAEAKKRKEENRAKRAAKEAKLAEKVMINSLLTIERCLILLK